MAGPKDIDQADDVGWVYACMATPTCRFVSSGWSSKRKAQERRRQHLEEHETREPAPELAELEARP